LRSVSSHAAGVGRFELATPTRRWQQDRSKADGVQFLICANTLKERHIDWHKLYGVSEKDIVPSGGAELARLQGMASSTSICKR
jgi:uncharacterized protein